MSYRAVQGFQPWNRTLNPLLLKDDVGRNKPSAYDLPEQKFIYGKPLPRDAEGARDGKFNKMYNFFKKVTSQWNFHSNTYEKEPLRDFKQLNKMGVNLGVHKASQQSGFRKENDARVKVVKGKNALPLLIPEEDFRYGRSNRPSTPMKLVIGNCYGLDGEQRITETYQYLTQTAQYDKPVLIPRGNKASVLSYSYNKNKLESLSKTTGGDGFFKLSKFKSVLPRTNTHLALVKSNRQQLPLVVSNPNIIQIQSDIQGQQQQQ